MGRGSVTEEIPGQRPSPGESSVSVTNRGPRISAEELFFRPTTNRDGRYGILSAANEARPAEIRSETVSSVT